MSNQGFYKNQDYGSEDDKMMGDGFASIIDKNDFLLNYLNDYGNVQMESRNHQNIYNPFGSDMPYGYPSYPDQQKSNDPLLGIFQKVNPQHDAWMLQSMNENKGNYGFGNNQGYQNNQNYEEFDLGIKTKKVKATRETGTRRPVVEEPDMNSKMGLKNNIKNTYINKINSLITENKSDKADDEDSSSPDDRKDASAKKNMDVKKEPESANGQKGMKKIRSYDVLKSDELDKLNQKLARNRESARESRKRKKVYIELLEKKVETLTQELLATRKQLELNNTNMNKMNFQSKMMNNFVNGKQQLFDRLEKVIQTEDESEINLLIDSLRLRLGATGKERVNAINYFFRQVIDLLMPVHMKYLLWIACEGKDIFSSKDTSLLNNIPTNLINSTGLQNEVTDYFNELVKHISLTDTQKKSIQKYRKKLVKEKQTFEQLLVQLNQCRKAILKQTNSLQNVIDDFRNILTPVQTGKFLIILDKERNRKEFAPEKLWQILGMKREEDDDEDGESSESFQDDETESKDPGSRKYSAVTDNPEENVKE